MGFFKQLRQSVFGGNQQANKKRMDERLGRFTAPDAIGKRPVDPRQRNRNVTDATFEPLKLSAPPPEPVQTEQEEDEAIQKVLEREGIASAEAAFLSGQVHYVISSNVRYFQYLFMNDDGSPLNQLVVGFLDSSVYIYEQVTLEEALIFYRTTSPGGAVWDILRERGTVFGYKKDYRLASGDRVWHGAGPDSIARHEAVPKSGEPYKGYHPSLAYKDAKGAMGAKGGGVNLGKRGGSKKVAYFTPVKAKVD
jgi:hypothetical protein